MSRKDLGARAIFGVPLVLGALALIGLVGALLDDGVWDGIGATCLCAAAVAVAWMRLRPAR